MNLVSDKWYLSYGTTVKYTCKPLPNSQFVAVAPLYRCINLHPQQVVKKWFGQMIDALKFVHDKQVIHR